MIESTVAPRAAASDAVLRVASDLFYREGVRAVGMDLIVERSGVAKTTIYRHFPTKDALVEAFLDHEDRDFWRQWDEVVAPHAGDPLRALLGLCDWIGERVSRDSYRGCPQINVAAEFADCRHPARRVADRHKAQMTARLATLCRALTPATATLRAHQIGLLFDGAFTSGGRLGALGAASVLADAVRALVGGGRAAG